MYDCRVMSDLIATIDMADPSTDTVEKIGSSLIETGFFCVVNHGIDSALLAQAYARAEEFFLKTVEEKRRYEDPAAAGQRGFTSFGKEHAKDSSAPDLKEFYQVGRTNVSDDHPVHATFGPNRWPDDIVSGFSKTFSALYDAMDVLGDKLLEACATHIKEDKRLFADMAKESDTIIRVIHYPPITGDIPAGGVRAAAHEDINLITLLPSATSEGLELLDRDGNWHAIEAPPNAIIVDSGDMLQNVTNGLYKSTTHRVVNPKDLSNRRFSMPCFIHPRREVDLSPLDSCREFSTNFQSISAGAYLDQRLAEIGLR